MRISVEVELSMGHRLRHHAGLCRNYHGHNYLITFFYEDFVDRTTGMVVDFAELKKLVKQILEPYDHAMCLQSDDPLVKVAGEVLDTHEMGGGYYKVPKTKLVLLPCEPTAENLSRLWLWEMHHAGAVKCVAVEVRETRNTLARAESDKVLEHQFAGRVDYRE